VNESGTVEALDALGLAFSGCQFLFQLRQGKRGRVARLSQLRLAIFDLLARPREQHLVVAVQEIVSELLCFFDRRSKQRELLQWRTSYLAGRIERMLRRVICGRCGEQRRRRLLYLDTFPPGSA